MPIVDRDHRGADYTKLVNGEVWALGGVEVR